MKFKHLILSLLLITAVAASAQQAPRYIFYFIGDGMGISPVMAAQAYNRDVRHSDTPLNMLQMPVVSWCMTYSASAPITDSAAAGTALSTGHKTRNNMLGMDADTVAVTSIATQFHDRGYGVGIITSVGADDATPGAFYAHVPGRKMFREIDLQAARSGYEFLGGAGLGGLQVSDEQSAEIMAAMAAEGVQFVYGPDQIADINSRRVALLNTHGQPAWNIGYTIDSIPGVLNLPQMTATCLAHLQSTTPDAFFMMVEGGNIDHALHANDGGTAIKEILNFDQALGIALDFYREHPDETLILVTADHDTGGMSHIHSRTEQHNPLAVIDHQRISKEVFSRYCKALLEAGTPITWEQMRAYLTERLGLFDAVAVSPEREARLREMFDRSFNRHDAADQETLYANFNAFAVEVYALVNDAAGLGFTTTSHSGNPAPVFAIGVGAERFSALNNNCDLPRIIRAICNLPND